MAQEALQPKHSDPKLWLVECKPGTEREACVCLLQKAIDLAAKSTPLLIKAAFTQDHLKVKCDIHGITLLNVAMTLEVHTLLRVIIFQRFGTNAVWHPWLSWGGRDYISIAEDAHEALPRGGSEQESSVAHAEAQCPPAARG